MANERLNIPETLKVGFNKRTDTYSGKLAYVTYINAKNEIAKERSWNGWIDKSIDVETYENKPMEGFVLNKRAGGYKSGWNFRQTKCRVYDPRGFEIEISVENLLYILQECTSSKGKGLEGEFVYAWSGPDLILLPVNCEDYQASMNLKNKQEKITLKDLKPSAAYKGKESDYLIYIGKMDWYVWQQKEEPRPSYYVPSEWYNELRKVTLATFVDTEKRKFRGYKNMNSIDFLIEENVISLDDVETYKENYMSTPAYQIQYIKDITLNDTLEKWEEFKSKRIKNQWGYYDNSKYLYLKRPGDDYITKLCAEKKLYLDDMTEYNWLNKNIPYSATKEERQKAIDYFYEHAVVKFSFTKSSIITYTAGRLKENHLYSRVSNPKEEINISDDDWKYMSDGGVVCFTSSKDDNIIKNIGVPNKSLSTTEIDFNKEKQSKN